MIQKPKEVQKVFSKYGAIRSLRFRSISVQSTPLSHFDKKLLKKAAVIKNNLNDEKKCVNAYIVYEKKESVDAALELNNTVIACFSLFYLSGSFGPSHRGRSYYQEEAHRQGAKPPYFIHRKPSIRHRRRGAAILLRVRNEGAEVAARGWEAGGVCGKRPLDSLEGSAEGKGVRLCHVEGRRGERSRD